MDDPISILGEERAGAGTNFYKDLIVKHKENPRNTTRCNMLAICQEIRLAPSLHTLDIDTRGANCAHLLAIHCETKAVGVNIVSRWSYCVRLTCYDAQGPEQSKVGL